MRSACLASSRQIPNKVWYLPIIICLGRVECKASCVACVCKWQAPESSISASIKMTHSVKLVNSPRQCHKGFMLCIQPVEPDWLSRCPPTGEDTVPHASTLNAITPLPSWLRVFGEHWHGPAGGRTFYTRRQLEAKVIASAATQQHTETRFATPHGSFQRQFETPKASLRLITAINLLRRAIHKTQLYLRRSATPPSSVQAPDSSKSPPCRPRGCPRKIPTIWALAL